MAKEREYVLGHSEAELARLVSQSSFFGDLTEDLLRRAGVGTGMRVLDVGCGAGDVSFLVRSLVGPEGSVHGVDLAGVAVSAARGRAEAAEAENVTFETADVTKLQTTERFDAVVGRLILLYLSDPVATVRSLARLIRPGGVIIFQEFDLTTARSVPEVPLFEAHMELVRKAFGGAGATVDMGTALYPILRAAGLQNVMMIGHTRIEAGPASQSYEQLAGIARTLLPVMERLGLGTAATLELDTFADRLRAAVVERDAVIYAPRLVGAWARMAG